MYNKLCHTPDRLRRNTILSSLGRAYPSDPQGFVLGSSRSNFPGWSPILGLLQPPTRLTSEFPVLRSQVVTHPGIAPASNSLNFGVPSNPKPVSSQKASCYEDARCAI
ncbi:hypothetical protein L3X38_027157 [Prunus dulcis]|uniref:Uncharacterized protein n=1 Tax=Prunus dulcis TaxID=3755 RepID=A0AAD4VNA2_PRUDU|nr:hypothetical protein L3X38_027157 [Prunus dulcis]